MTLQVNNNRYLKIRSGGVDLNYVKEDISITDINNSFTREFYHPHTTYPLRLVEDNNYVAAFGKFDITSRNKKKYFPGEITLAGINHPIEIEIIGRAGINFIKINIVILDDLYPILNRPIKDFMPKINLMGQNPDLHPYTEQSENRHVAWLAFLADAMNRQYLIFPESDYIYPNIELPMEETKDPEYEGVWKHFEGYINRRRDNFQLLLNSVIFDEENGVFEVENKNIVAPQVYLLAPLKKALESIDYKATGDLMSNLFIRSSIFEISANQMTDWEATIPGESLYLGTTWYNFPIQFINIPLIARKANKLIESPGRWTVKWKLFVDQMAQGAQSIFGMGLGFDDSIDQWSYFDSPGEYEGEFILDLNILHVNKTLEIWYFHRDYIDPVSYSIEFSYTPEAAVIYKDVHPTIELGRYVPDWTLGEYINNLKNLYNLKIDIYHENRTVNFSFNRDFIKNKKNHVTIPQSCLLDIKNIEEEFYCVKHSDNRDDYVLIQDGEVTVNTLFNSDKTKIFETAFKYVPWGRGTNVLTPEYLDMDGVGLLLYKPNLTGYTVPSIDFFNYLIPGQYGIYATFWRDWISFLIKSNPVDCSTVVSPLMLQKLKSSKSAYINHQAFIIESLKYKPEINDSFRVDMVLRSLFF
jgi:hypothetical protein